MTPDDDIIGMGEVPRMDSELSEPIHFNGSTKLVLWALGIFGSVMIVLLTLVLQAVYTTNGNVNNLAGQQASTQRQMDGMQQEISAFQQEMVAIVQRESR